MPNFAPTIATPTTFNEFNLHHHILQAVNLCGYTSPTPVQQQSIPEILNGRDVVASAQTGTGKTASFVLPALHHLSKQPNKKPRVLILTPTRELATQITKAASTYGKFLRFNIVSLVGGMPYHHQIRDLSRGANIIVATPGRLIDHLENKRVDLSHIDMLVLDEADRMLDMGFIDDVKLIAELTPAHRQTLLFSATVDNRLSNIIKQLLKNPVRINLSQEKIAAPKIQQLLYKANNAPHKTRMLKHLLNDTNVYKAIIFSATKINADKLAKQLRDEGYATAALHGDLRQNVRNRTLSQFRSGAVQFVVATDVAARGIDISDITHVINYDLPKCSEDYVHRIGRTGRAGKSGTAISFVQTTDMGNLKRIERYIGQRFQFHQLELSDAEPQQPRIAIVDEYKTEPRHETKHRQEKSFSRDKTKRTDYRNSARQEHFGDKKRERHFDKSARHEHFDDKKRERHFDKSARQENFDDKKRERHFDKSENKKQTNDDKRKVKHTRPFADREQIEPTRDRRKKHDQHDARRTRDHRKDRDIDRERERRTDHKTEQTTVKTDAKSRPVQVSYKERHKPARQLADRPFKKRREKTDRT